jgi:hypothetical protein
LSLLTAQEELEKLRRWPPDDLRDLPAILDPLRRQAEQLSDDVRDVSHQLHRAILEELGLESALRQLAGEFERVHEMPVDFITQPLGANGAACPRDRALPDSAGGITQCGQTRSGRAGFFRIVLNLAGTGSRHQR